MNEIDKISLLELARNALAEEEPDISRVAHLNNEKIVFVAFKKNGKIRGGIGLLEKKPLYRGVIESARKAASDPRFPKITDPGGMKVEISVINSIEKLKGSPDSYPEQIQTGKDGLMMKGDGKSLLLPNVCYENSYTALQFLNALAQAAGLSFNAWKNPNNEIYKFSASVFSD